MNSTRQIPTVLSIAGFDASGGAGIQADLKTFTSLSCYGMSVLTVLPIQNTQGITNIYPISAVCVKEQLVAVLEDCLPHAIKVGALHCRDVVECLCEVLQAYPMRPLVFDPVMGSTGGFALLERDALPVLKKKLFPLTTLLTPNLPEASILLGRRVLTQSDMEAAARGLADKGPKSILIKGGHLEGNECADCLYHEGKIHWFFQERIDTGNTHGTGCTLSSALAAYLAKGFSMLEAVELGKKTVWRRRNHVPRQTLFGKRNQRH